MIRIFIATLAFACMIAGNSRLLILLTVSEASLTRFALQLVACLAGLTAAALLYYAALVFWQ